MNISQVAVGLVSLVVAVIVVALVAIPVIEDTTTGTSFEGTNASYETAMTHFESGPTFTWAYSGSGTSITVGGVTTSMPLAMTMPEIAAKELVVRATTTGVAFYDLANSTYTVYTGPTTLAVSSGSYTLTNGDTTKTGSLTEGFYRNPAGDWGTYTSAFKVTPSDAYYLGSWFNFNGNGPIRLIEMTGDEAGDALFTPFTTGSGGTIVTNWTVELDVDYTTVGTGQVVGQASGVSADYTNGSTTGTSTEFIGIAPITFESETTEDLGTNGALLMIIPLLLIIVAIMVAARLLKDA